MPKVKKKTQKKEATTAEFVESINKQGSKRNGAKKQFSWKR